MTCDALTRLLHQIEALRKLAAAPGAIPPAARECAREIERLAGSDLASDYARSLRLALERGPRLSHHAAREHIDSLVAYVLMLSLALLGRLSAPRKLPAVHGVVRARLPVFSTTPRRPG